MSEVAREILSDITVFGKYARFKHDLGRRETWKEIVDRNKAMHIAKFPQVKELINEVYERSVYTKQILPSMRSLQFAGVPIERNPSRIYNCFSGNTEFLTDKGSKKFEDVVDTTVNVLNINGEWVPAEVKSFGKQDMNVITLKHPYRTNLRLSFEATANHRWVLEDGSITTNLEVGDRLKYSIDEMTDESEEYDEGFVHGMVFADGTKAKANRFMIRLCGTKADNLYLLQGHPDYRTVCYPPSFGGDPVVTLVTNEELKELPSNKSKEYIAGFIEAWLAFDGSQKKGFESYCLDTIDEEAADWLIKNAPYAGFIATGINVTNNPTNYGERSKPLNRISLAPSAKYWLVECIEGRRNYGEVYCVVEPTTQTFTLAGGVLTGNCAYLPIEDTDAFAEIMFLLLGGTGVGYSVQYRHVDKLPPVLGPSPSTRRYVIGDSIEGWADAVKVLVESYFYAKDKVEFDYGDIREKGSELVTSGGKAPGPAPLRECLDRVRRVLDGAYARKLKPIEAHDIACYLADAVLAGGIRRAAMISLFSIEDNEMIDSKSGEWYIDNPQRARANNSVTLLRGTVSKADFRKLWERVRASGAGEPGFYWTNNLDWGTNPCCEIALRPYSFCNLSEIDTSTITSQEDFNQRARDAAFIGTLQAAYTSFHYLRPIWQRTTEEDALIGVGLTGIASNAIKELDEAEAANIAKITNKLVANMIGVKHAARVTTVKPSGTSSLVVGSSSGIHAWHDHFYVRRMRFNNDEAILQYLSRVIPSLIEPEHFRPEAQSVVMVPQSAPVGATIRTETALDLLERTARYNERWIGTGHRRGDNHNNVSVTVSIKEDEWDEVGEWMYENRASYNGISVLPYDGGSYIQAPFETITKEQYEELSKHLKHIDLSKVYEKEDNTDLTDQAACAGGGCEIDEEMFKI